MKSKFVEKLGDQYELLSGYKTATEVKNILKESNLPLSKEQYAALRNAFGDSGMCGNLDMPFIAYKWKENKNKICIFEL